MTVNGGLVFWPCTPYFGVGLRCRELHHCTWTAQTSTRELIKLDVDLELVCDPWLQYRYRDDLIVTYDLMHIDGEFHEAFP